MKKDYNHIIALIDRSGSMKPLVNETIQGFNGFLNEQKQVPGTATISLYQFNHMLETSFQMLKLEHAAPLTSTNYKAEGWTALLDAVGQVIDTEGGLLGKMQEHERPSKVIMMIVTDGEENKSKSFIYSKIKEMVSHQTDKYSWSFMFLGANLDAFSAAGSLGIAAASSINYVANSIGTLNAYKTASRGLAKTRIASSFGVSVGDMFNAELCRESVTSDKLDSTPIKETIAEYTSTVVTNNTERSRLAYLADALKSAPSKSEDLFSIAEQGATSPEYKAKLIELRKEIKSKVD